MTKKRIFTFWEPKDKLPAYIKLCMQTWKKFLPEYDIVVLDYQNLEDWFDKKAIKSFVYKKTTLPKQADCIRAALLYKYGGIWMDADTIITKSNFINNKDEVLMIGTKTGAHGAFICAKKPGTEVITEWYNQILQRVKTYRLVNACKLFRKIFPKKYATCAKWDYFLNSIIDPMVRTTDKKHLHVLQRDTIKAFPEHFSKLNKENVSPSELYRDFYFLGKDSVPASKIIQENQGIILLHNSWTPQEYKNMSEQEFLNSGVKLAEILKSILK